MYIIFYKTSLERGSEHFFFDHEPFVFIILINEQTKFVAGHLMLVVCIFYFDDDLEAPGM
jgi:hypothetical protein